MEIHFKNLDDTKNNHGYALRGFSGVSPEADRLWRDIAKLATPAELSLL